MVEDTAQQGADPTGPGIGPRPTPVAMCSMATMCKGLMEQPSSGFLLMLPGAVLVVVGVLTIIDPTILVWLVATASVLLGIMLLMMANFIRRLGVRLRNKSSGICCSRPSNGEPCPQRHRAEQDC